MVCGGDNHGFEDSLLDFGLRLPTNVQLNYPEQAVPIPGLYTFTPGFDHRALISLGLAESLSLRISIGHEGVSGPPEQAIFGRFSAIFGRF